MSKKKFEGSLADQIPHLEGEIEHALDKLDIKELDDLGLSRDQLKKDAISDAPAILDLVSEEWVALRTAEEELGRLSPRSWIPQPSRTAIYVSRRPTVVFGATAIAGLAWLAFLLGLTEPLQHTLPPFAVSGMLALAALPILLLSLIRFADLSGPHRFERMVALSEKDVRLYAYRSALRRVGVDGWLNTRRNLALGTSFETKLQFRNASALAEIDDPANEIPTSTKDRLAEIMSFMPGGAIGLAGSRGSGKSTLIRNACGSDDSSDDRGTIGIVVDAPVQYDPREFVLHLFATLCSEVLGPARVRQLRGWNRDGPAGNPNLETFPLALGSLLMATGVTIALGLGAEALRILNDPLIIGIGIGTAGFLLIMYGMVRVSSDHISNRFRLQPEARVSGLMLGLIAGSDDDRWEEFEAEVIAETRLRQIWFQQSFSTGWSGSLNLPVGLGGEITHGIDISQKQMSLPDIVDLLKEFIALLARNQDVRIGIDELDKMSDESARLFLNEIKVIFRIPGCFFLVSVSEDAMAGFDRRGHSFRDVFDSSFDDVLHVPSVKLETSHKILNRRIVGLPLPFISLMHCMSGGLPRDLIRATRNLIALGPNTTLIVATELLVGMSLGNKLRSTRVSTRSFDNDDLVAALAPWLSAIEKAGTDDLSLLATCRDFESLFMDRISDVKTDVIDQADRREAQRLAVQLLGYMYFSATTIELFREFSDAEFVKKATGTNGAGSPSPFVDRLAGVHDLFGGDIRFTWETLSDLRRDAGFVPVNLGI